jgi:hypothetical protein
MNFTKELGSMAWLSLQRMHWALKEIVMRKASGNLAGSCQTGRAAQTRKAPSRSGVLPIGSMTLDFDISREGESRILAKVKLPSDVL